jgi:hypothetical protein
MALKVLLLTGQRPGEVTHMRFEHIADGWWTLPGSPDATTKWPATKNSQTHRVWLPQPAGTLHKSNSVDQVIVFKGGRMSLDKVRYGPDKVWNEYRALPADDGNGNKTFSVWFGPIQEPRLQEVDNAGIFMSALQETQPDFNGKTKVSEMQKLFVELDLSAQERIGGPKSKNPKEMARSAFGWEMDSAVKCGLVATDKEYVWEVEHGNS